MEFNNIFDINLDAPADVSFSELHQKPFDTSMLDQCYTVPSNQDMLCFDLWDIPQLLSSDYGQHQSHTPQQQQQQQQQQPTPPFSPAELSLSPMSAHASCNSSMSPPMMQQDMEQLLLAITSPTPATHPPPVPCLPEQPPPPPQAPAAEKESTRSSDSTERAKAVTSKPSKSKKGGATRSTRRRTVHDLPYAPNLLNLNLAPVKRIRASSSSNSSAARHASSSSSQQPRSATPFRCDFPGCDKTFTRPYNLKSHRRTHTLERPFGCDLCPKRFARQHDRNRHTKLHYGIKPYVCQICNKAFARQDALNRHQRPDENNNSSMTCASAGHRSRGGAKRGPRKKI